ncbi:MAG: hypothetical protein IJ094_05045 [Bacilli bacterium]|nr:hypothetical protein [Bacilli bacterium]
MINVNELFKNYKNLIGKEIRIKLKDDSFMFGVLDSFIPKGIYGNDEDMLQIKYRNNEIQLYKSNIVNIEENI